jgi:uncharacterized Fe-S cluster protein YjdI
MSNYDKKYSNDEITVYWQPSKCVHATTCLRELIDVFNPRKRPWVNMNGAKTEKIIEVVNKCPTQALSYKYNNDIVELPMNNNSELLDEMTPEDVLSQLEDVKIEGAKISIMKNGPILVEGEFRIIGTDGNELKSMIMTSFCRCGNSRAQPFCDGTHRKVGFQG